jgi:hypothetical protein
MHGGWAYSINERGEIAGYCINELLQRRAVIWRNLELYDLNELVVGGGDWLLESAWAINEKGQIVGAGRLGGVESGFLLTPISRR